jgi:hypothetical protein
MENQNIAICNISFSVMEKIPHTNILFIYNVNFNLSSFNWRLQQICEYTRGMKKYISHYMAIIMITQDRIMNAIR